MHLPRRHLPLGSADGSIRPYVAGRTARPGFSCETEPNLLARTAKGRRAEDSPAELRRVGLPGHHRPRPTLSLRGRCGEGRWFVLILSPIYGAIATGCGLAGWLIRSECHPYSRAFSWLWNRRRQAVEDMYTVLCQRMLTAPREGCRVLIQELGGPCPWMLGQMRHMHAHTLTRALPP